MSAVSLTVWFIFVYMSVQMRSMLSYFSWVSHAFVLESLVRNCSNCLGGLCDLDRFDRNGDSNENLGAGVTGRGNLLGLCSLKGSSPALDPRLRPCRAADRDTTRVLWGPYVELGHPLTVVFSGVEGITDDPRVLLGCKGSREGATRADVPLGLGPSCDSSCVPNDVAGLVEPIFDGTRIGAKELFTRLRL